MSFDRMNASRGIAVGLGFLVALACAQAAGAATYYVAKSGSDSNSCTQSQPCLTIGRAKTLATQAGDVVQVAAGTYTERVTLSSSGSATASIVVRGHDGTGCPGATVSDVNHPSGANPNPPVIIVGGFTIQANYLTIDCFHVKSSGGGDVVSAQAGTHHVTIANNDIDGNNSSTPGEGIGFTGIASVQSSQYANNYSITHNYIHGVSGGLFLVCSSCVVTDNEIKSLQGDTGSDLDYINVWGTNTTIRHNYMHENTINACNGYDCHMDCIQTWNTTGNGTEVSKNITFDRNICFNHHEGVIVQDNSGNGDVSNWTVTNNVFAFPPWDDGSGHMGQAGPVHPWCWIFEDGQLGASNVFYNNTCVNGAVGFRNASGTASFKNNIYYGQTGIYANGGGTSVNGGTNLQYAPGSSFGSGTFTGDVINQNPNFVSVGSNSQRCIGCNFRLQSTSGAKDKGSNPGSLVTVDYDGTPRPQGTSFDIGAFEFTTGVVSAPAAPENVRVLP